MSLSGERFANLKQLENIPPCELGTVIAEDLSLLVKLVLVITTVTMAVSIEDILLARNKTPVTGLGHCSLEPTDC